MNFNFDFGLSSLFNLVNRDNDTKSNIGNHLFAKNKSFDYLQHPTETSCNKLEYDH
jgi:hypothetical protein